jgi:hypothetical protein
VEYGLGAGCRPADFGLERISVGGEVVTAGLKARAQRLFGQVRFDEGYALTETWPFGGTVCEAGHLHFEPTRVLLEVLRLDGGGAAALEALGAPDTPETLEAPAGPGEPGRLVVTPLPPYREATVVLRYDTEDVVWPLPGPLACSQRHVPATTNVWGKRRLAVQHERHGQGAPGSTGWTFPRQVAEALEVSEAVPLPARYGLWAVPGGVAVEALVRPGAAGARGEIERRLEEQGVPVRELRLVEDRGQLQRAVPLRCDLRELSFGPPAFVSGAPADGQARRQPRPAAAPVGG